MKPLPEWNPTLSVGNEVIDEQHARLLKLGREVLAQIASSSADLGSFHQVLNDIAEAAAAHFATEEALLERNACPTLEEHRAEHFSFLERLVGILADGMEGGDGRQALVRFIEEFAAHIEGTDHAAAAYLRPVTRASAAAHRS